MRYSSITDWLDWLEEYDVKSQCSLRKKIKRKSFLKATSWCPVSALSCHPPTSCTDRSLRIHAYIYIHEINVTWYVGPSHSHTDRQDMTTGGWGALLLYRSSVGYRDKEFFFFFSSFLLRSFVFSFFGREDAWFSLIFVVIFVFVFSAARRRLPGKYTGIWRQNNNNNNDNNSLW